MDGALPEGALDEEEPALARLSGAFVDPEVEAGFQRAHIEQTRWVVRAFALLALAGAFAGSAAAYASLGPESRVFWWTTAGRAVLALVCAGGIALYSAARRPGPLYAYNLFAGAVAFATVALRTSSEPASSGDPHTLLHVSREGLSLLLIVSLAVLTLVPGWFLAHAALLGAVGAGLVGLLHVQSDASVSLHGVAATAAVAFGVVVTVGRLVQRLRRRSYIAQERLRASNAALHRLASTDPLTGCANRRYFFASAESERRRARRHGRPLATLLIDIDRFKELNDQHGHAAGDAVLREVVALLGRSVRASDTVGRVGGEEFAILLPETTAGSAVGVAERLRGGIAGLAMRAGEAELGVTVSIGVSALGEEETSIDAALVRADRALYRAKAAGRDAVALEEPC